MPSTPKETGARKNRIRNNRVGINKGCKVPDKKEANRVFKAYSFFSQSYQFFFNARTKSASVSLLIRKQKYWAYILDINFKPNIFVLV